MHWNCVAVTDRVDGLRKMSMLIFVSTDLDASPVAARQHDAMAGRAFEGTLLEMDGNTDVNKMEE